jgi:hypothetical protein
LALGAVLDSVANAISLMTPLVSSLVSAFIVLLWLLARLVLPSHPLPWVVGNQYVLVRSLGRKPTAFAAGMVLLLGIPSVVTRWQPQPPSSSPPTTGNRAHQSIGLAALRAEPQTANVLYETGTTRSRFEDWAVSSTTPDWIRLNGMLLNKGTHHDGSFAPILAPYTPESANYAVEADIRAIRDGHSFGVVVRARGRQGYAVGVGQNLMQRTPNICYLDGLTSWYIRRGCIDPRAGVQVFDPGLEWHTYYTEANGNKITLRIDGKEMISVADNMFLSAGSVGLWSSGYQLEVRNFKVIALN